MKLPHTRLVERVPFIQQLLQTLVQRFLDLSEVPHLRGSISLLMKERNLTLFHEQILRDSGDDIYRFLQLLETTNGRGLELKRLGSIHDGGYLIPTVFSYNCCWMTLGLGQNVDFENSLSSNACQVISFDHTLRGRTKNLNKKVQWFPFGISSTQTDQLIDIHHALKLAGLEDSNWCLKSDIEGYEWEFLPQLFGLKNLPQVIVIELHDILNILNPKTFKFKLEILKELSDRYEIVHANINNFAPVLAFQGLFLPDVLELTLVEKSYTPSESSFASQTNEVVPVSNNPRQIHIPLRLPKEP